jgi:hypothetical protein
MLTERFDRTLLPAARTFYQQEFGSALGKERRGWAQTKCCFHGGQSKTSLSLNMDEGHFRCFSCGASGGDLVAFVMRRDQVKFTEAAQVLGAWRAAPESLEARRARTAMQAERDRQRAAAEQIQQDIRTLRLQYRSDIHLYQWNVNAETLPASVDLLRRAVAAYNLLAFGAMAERIKFLRSAAGERERTINQILDRGFVRCEDGYRMDVAL